ncbi:MAG: hypothetical protein LBU51_09975 [Bacteroidales bacterium]|jgi:predicted transcriptional regulator of viral defense system|nr:hypothetical protein [Bacteroidales bacterium]
MREKKLKEAFETKNGIIKMADISAIPMYYRDVQKLIKQKVIEKIRNGYYQRCYENRSTGEASIIASLFQDGVICMYSALFYYNYSDRVPMTWDIAVDKNTSKARFNLKYPSVHPHYMKKSQLEYGVITVEIEGCKLNIFDRDRLMCECMMYMKKMDKELFNKAIQGYVSDNKKNISNLLEYARKRRVNRKIRDIIGVWL